MLFIGNTLHFRLKFNNLTTTLNLNSDHSDTNFKMGMWVKAKVTNFENWRKSKYYRFKIKEVHKRTAAFFLTNLQLFTMYRK